MTGKSKKHPLYNVWHSMIRRCYDKRYAEYENYGGKGLTVCDRWRASLYAFADDMGDRPSPMHSIDRKDNSRGYEPDNCRWATPKEQADNSSWPLRLIFNGVERILIDVGREHGLKPDTVHCRLKHGWDPIKAVTTPLHAVAPMRFVEFRGKQRRVSELATEFGVPRSRLFRRLDAGWSIEEALFLPSRNTRKAS